MKLHLHSIDKTLFDGEVGQIGLPAEDGVLTILPGHVPLVTVLKNGVIEAKTKNENKTFEIRGGFAQIHGNSAIILVD
ncbi:MAG: F0F1 ATP synthase subunit epsilon [Candidatus Paceibacterota bacterium]|jgi:F-type H+-transporting ATPase subunit epsilon